MNIPIAVRGSVLRFSKRPHLGYRLANLLSRLTRNNAKEGDYQMRAHKGLAIGAFVLMVEIAAPQALADGHAHGLMKQIETKIDNKVHANPIAERRMAMRTIGSNMKTIASYLRTNEGAPADVSKSATTISSIAKVAPAHFPAGTGLTRYPSVTGAKPEIFSNSAGFKKAAMVMYRAAENLAKVASTPNTEKKEIGEAFGALGKSCGSCHKVYRKKLKKQQ